MRTLILLVFIATLLGCGGNLSRVGYMDHERQNETTGQWEKVSYSPYFEHESRSDDGVLLTRIVVTLGPERVPDGYEHTGMFAKDLKRSYRDGIVDWVSEIYFINTSDRNALVTPLSLAAGGQDITFTKQYEIAPSKWKITPPLIKLDSVYGRSLDFNYTYHYKGKDYSVTGKAKRLTVQEVSAKYGS